ncbi:MAG: hypothetical protein KBC96_12485 [Armatimonadetes bacterium]|nr:hypothetical protein [Armatimonadota bacterium]
MTKSHRALTRALLAILAMGLLSIIPLTAARDLGTSEDYAEKCRLEIERFRVDIDRTAVLVDRLSDGKSRLLIKSPKTLDPPCVAMVNRDGGREFVMVYRVTQPFDAELGNAGKCRVLGAVYLQSGGRIAGTMHELGSGTYILAYQEKTRTRDEGVAVFTFAVSDHGRLEYKEIGRARLDSHSATQGTSKPYVAVWFPNDMLILEQNPFNRATVDMAWERESYSFKLVDIRVECG